MVFPKSKVFIADPSKQIVIQPQDGIAVFQLLGIPDGIDLSRAHRGYSHTPLERSIAHIKTSYTEEISIPELAAMEGLSVSRYNAVFKESTGVSPVKYITDLRITHACSLLQSTNLHVKEIGVMVGYKDNHFFSKAFKAKIGMSPREYREQK